MAEQIAFVGGKVWTAGYAAPRALDVLVANGRIVDVRRDGSQIPSGYEIVDARGRLIAPGFQDAHIHPLAGGLNLVRCNLMDIESPAAALDTIRGYAEELAPDAWVLGGGWQRDLFGDEGPTRQALDEATGGRPALLRSYDCHGAWINSRALELAGIEPTTPFPDGGWYLRDGEGLPRGVLEEHAIDLVSDLVPAESRGLLRRAMTAADEYLVSLGITSVQDALVGDGLGMTDPTPVYRELIASGRWRSRLTAALWWEPRRGVEQIPELIAKRRALESLAGTDVVLADTVKLMIDGANTLFIDQRSVLEAVVALDKAGFSCHFHTYGELATKWSLDAVEAARHGNPASKGRHQIAHLMVVAPEDFARFRPLGVTANLQLEWGRSSVNHDVMGLTTCSRTGHEREYAFGRLAAAGASLAAGSDWPVSTPDPLSVSRHENARGRERDSDLATGEPDELDRIDLVTALAAYTAGSAFVNGRSSFTGRIAPTFCADLAILTQDPFESAAALEAAQVFQTWIGGKLAYQRAAE